MQFLSAIALDAKIAVLHTGVVVVLFPKWLVTLQITLKRGHIAALIMDWILYSKKHEFWLSYITSLEITYPNKCSKLHFSSKSNFEIFKKWI
mmetsp:Transcript_27085/g.41551  ORF Transcript_27085/g.41551 Transcript_27085/m.41551 type:complete len:92 (+) Transcript_27085:340-615(+)